MSGYEPEGDHTEVMAPEFQPMPMPVGVSYETIPGMMSVDELWEHGFLITRGSRCCHIEFTHTPGKYPEVSTTRIDGAYPNALEAQWIATCIVREGRHLRLTQQGFYKPICRQKDS